MSPGIMAALAVGQIGISFVSPGAATALGCLLVVPLVLVARVEFMPALMLTQFSAADFGALGGEIPTLTLLGFPFNVSYLLAFAVAVRVTWEFLRTPHRMRPVRWLLALWYVAMAAAVAMSLEGRWHGNPSWTVGIRLIWLCGGFFYGRILARSWPSDDREFTGRFAVFLTVLFALFVSGYFFNQLVFLLAPAAVPVAWLAWRQGGRFRRTLAVLLLVLGVMLGFALGAGAEEDGEVVRYGAGGASLTMNGLFVGSVALTIGLARGSRRLMRRMSFSLGWPVVTFVIVASILVASLGPRVWVPTVSDLEQLSSKERISAKLFGDRSVIWHAALKDSLKPPYFIKPSGSPLWIESVDGELEWLAGAHNAVLNTLSRQRWLAGPIVLALFFVAMRRNAVALASASSNSLSALCIVVAVTGTVGAFVNDYPLGEAAFWFFSFCGITAAAVEQQTEDRPTGAGTGMRVGRSARLLNYR